MTALASPRALLLAAGAMGAAAALPACGSGSSSSSSSAHAASSSSTSSAGGAGGSGGSGGDASGSSSSASSSSASTGGAAGSGGSGGGGEACTPGDSRPCYTGPAGTEGVGVCHGGIQVCNPTGVGFGNCTDQVVPTTESCFTPDDDDCDGVPNQGCICTPGDSMDCYDGPAGTLGVGLCQGGKAVCDLTGKAYGPCLGEVLPSPPNCASSADEDCDGKTPACTGAYLSARAMGSTLDEEGLAVGVAPTGHVTLGGYTTGATDFGCGALPAGAGEGAIVVRLDPAGACLWSKRFGDISRVSAVAVGVDGASFVAGSFSGTIDLGGGVTLSSAGQTDAFIAKLDTTGAPVWARRFGGTGIDVATGVALNDVEEPVVVGTFQASADFGSGAVASAGGNDLFVVKLDGGGTPVWSRTFGDSSNQAVNAVTISQGYNIVFTGGISGTVDFGGGPLASAGLADLFVAELDDMGGHLFSQIWGDQKDQSGAAIKADALGNVYVAGTFDGTLDLGGAKLTTAGGQDAFLFSLDVARNYRSSRAAGGLNTQSASALAVDSYGNVAFGGLLLGTADLGTGPLTGAGGGDVFVGKYDPAGNPLWSHRFGDPAAQVLEGLAFAPDGSLWMTGILSGSADFGGGAVTSAGGEDVFLAHLAP